MATGLPCIPGAVGEYTYSTENDLSPAFVIVFVLLALGAIAWTIVYQQRRVKAAKAWAASIGWQYIGTNPSLTNKWRGQPFSIGRSRRVTELMVGPFLGRQAASFRYTYTTGSGKNRSTYTFHVLTVGLPAYLADLELTPEGLGTRIAKVFGGQDIQFESDDFNAAWRVKAADAKFAHDIVHPRLMERLLYKDARGLSLRIEAMDILCWDSGAPHLEEIAPRLQVMCAVIDSVPRYVWLDHGYDPGPVPDEPPGRSGPLPT